ncbi:family 16 glycosylhydrolase [Streptomyces sp. NPDC050560]|uniref:glycoside hydrolase family 16 protein n=1 Tax=Streptomyces sp. NPDC050560 TaxID=3365630 RepID=UPI0037A5F3F8
MRRTRVIRMAGSRRVRSTLAASALVTVVALAAPALARADGAGTVTGPGTTGSGGRAAAKNPADVLDLDDWKLTLPTGEEGDGTQAAQKYGWGDPLPVSDEFDDDGPVDPGKWSTPSGDEGGTEGCWPGHSDHGRRCAKNSVVDDGVLTMTGDENGDTGWLRQKRDAHYGRWEIRSRSSNTGDDGATYHPLHLIWPTSDDRLADGEYDWVEYTDPDSACLGAWLHYPDSPGDEKKHVEDCSVDMTKWHNFAFDWSPDGLTGYVDGKQYFHLADGADEDRGDIQAMPEGNLCIQLDNFTGTSGVRPARFEVDWVRTYASE